MPSGCMEDEGSVSAFKVDTRTLSVVGKAGFQSWTEATILAPLLFSCLIAFAVPL